MPAGLGAVPEGFAVRVTTPASDVAASYVFRYTVTDPSGATATALVFIGTPRRHHHHHHHHHAAADDHPAADHHDHHDDDHDHHHHDPPATAHLSCVPYADCGHIGPRSAAGACGLRRGAHVDRGGDR